MADPRMRILIVGAAGTLGREIAAEGLQSGQVYKVY